MKYEPLKLSLENLRKFAESRIELAKEELEKTGYYDDWDNIDDLARSKMEAFNLGRNVAMENLMTVLLRIVDETEDKIKRHVKSVVLGLLEEIEKIKKSLNESIKQAEKEDVSHAKYDFWFALDIVEQIEGKIKKSFPDVVEE